MIMLYLALHQLFWNHTLQLLFMIRALLKFVMKSFKLAR